MSSSEIAPVPLIESRIYLIRGQKVLLDADLAILYDVLTKNLNLAVRRNRRRFPEDFMFQLTAEEVESLRLQSATSNEGRGGRRYLPYAFTEQGIAMLSTVLRSERAIEVNIAIMRTFVRLRQLLATHEEIARRLEDLEWPSSFPRDHAGFEAGEDAVRDRLIEIRLGGLFGGLHGRSLLGVRGRTFALPQCLVY